MFLSPKLQERFIPKKLVKPLLVHSYLLITFVAFVKKINKIKNPFFLIYENQSIALNTTNF